MQLNPCPLQAQWFTSDRGRKLMFADASDLGFKAGQVPGGALYDDAADFGITLRNTDKGTVAHWYESDMLFHNGEQIGWRYKPTNETLRKHPNLKGWEVHILND